jgi:hypothetical protein
VSAVEAQSGSDDVLFPQPEPLTVGGKELQLLAVSVGQLPKLARALRPVAKRLAELRPVGKSIGAPELAAMLIDECGDHVLEAIAVASSQHRAWVDGLNLAELIVLAEKLMEVNVDFFVRYVIPTLEKLAGEMATTGWVSRLPSNVLSSTATATTP